ncbi:type II toxin-antitoxin system RelE/ParE family toxin [Desulfonatronum sp. SC1]|uniref:type II toxin-antitoxin system RelE family toxin n=1 Tax=Desulfonatronum sp. SC1 TaxID=2109626 RepID=UPI000D2FBC63|nr:type II toxin-antitoxin system RelE/ParE family toxin [Desulfonatronum sp. SC1]PTN32361.1 type II toxin-antitoxin system mRNA interferase toxin, RelE/StbE family [Desulfonatronum sp. SC1]
MGWSIKIDKPAKKELAKLGSNAAKDILKFLRKRIVTDEDPRRLGDPLRKDLSGLWKYRVGAYRVIADIQDDVFLVLVVRVAHRKKAYGGH